MEPGGIEPPSTRGISGRIRRFRRARSAGRSAGRTKGQTGRRTGSNGRPNRGTSPAHVAAERRGRKRPAGHRPGPPRGGVGQPARRRACRDRCGDADGHARPLTPPTPDRTDETRDTAMRRALAVRSVGGNVGMVPSRRSRRHDARGNSSEYRLSLFCSDDARFPSVTGAVTPAMEGLCLGVAAVNQLSSSSVAVPVSALARD